MDCLVPGTPFQRGLKRCLDAYTSREARVKHIMQQHYGIHQFPEVYLQRQKFLQAVIAPQKRLAALYYYTQTLSQGALFHIAVDVRFSAFEFLTQIRDESYNYSMCVLHRPDAVILQYTKHIEEYLTLLSLNLGHKKRKYIALTMARPIANLFLNEMSLLRDKRISISGQQRLLVNLLTIQSSIQLFLPGDMELAEAARDYLKPVQVFLSNLKNNNVTSSLISSEDYLLFSKSQVEALIELVFHSDGANDVYVEQIMNYRRKLEVISQDSQRIDDIARADKMEQERIVNEKFIMASAKWLEGGLPNPKPAMSTDVSPVAPPVMYGKEFGNDIVGDDDESCESLSSYTDDDCTDCSTEGE